MKTYKTGGGTSIPDRVLSAICDSALATGAVARAVSTTVISPLELIRTRQMNTQVHTTVRHHLNDVLKNNGVRGLWTGAGLTLARDVPFSGIYWMVVESIRASKRVRDWKDHKVNKTVGEFLVSLYSGAVGGLVAACCTTPMDVVKTRRQIELSRAVSSTAGNSVPGRGGAFDMWKDIADKEGLAGLWRGNLARCARVVPACAVMLGVFESTKAIMERAPR